MRSTQGSDLGAFDSACTCAKADLSWKRAELLHNSNILFSYKHPVLRKNTQIAESRPLWSTPWDPWDLIPGKLWVTGNWERVFVLFRLDNHVVLLNTRHQHQHGCQLGSEKVLKKIQNPDESGHADNCSYVKGDLVSSVSCEYAGAALQCLSYGFWWPFNRTKQL